MKIRSRKRGSQVCNECGKVLTLNPIFNFIYISLELALIFSLPSLLFGWIPFSYVIFHIAMIFILEYLRGLVVPLVKQN